MCSKKYYSMKQFKAISRAMLFGLQPEHTFGPFFFQMKLVLVYLLSKYIQPAHPLGSITNLFFIF